MTGPSVSLSVQKKCIIETTQTILGGVAEAANCNLHKIIEACDEALFLVSKWFQSTRTIKST